MSTLSPKDWLAILHRAARAGRSAILRNYNPESREKIMKRGVGGDLTLRIDQVSEDAIHKSLTHDLPSNSFVFVSEELGEVRVKDNEPRPVVICDPLDGSHNAQVGIPLFSLSLAVLGLKRKIRPSGKRLFGDVDVALIQSIMSNDEYSALKGEGSYHNGKPLKRGNSRKETRIKTFGIECGDLNYLKTLVSRLSSKQVYKFRVLGSAALSLSFLADGSLDALVFAQPGGARTIDSPAGYLIAKQAGCVFSDLSRNVRNIDRLEVGFHSRINLVGAGDPQTQAQVLRSVREP